MALKKKSERVGEGREDMEQVGSTVGKVARRGPCSAQGRGELSTPILLTWGAVYDTLCPLVLF